ncbi:fibronectin type III domain-containing protein [Phycicoccus sp. BSK3Z-2]|uniref:Fibronectin type III domain-containing protein n=1 Tax=Phycicoccus avicenniae TaxID=2828860 RepID=A0A941D8V1_9MICO|nr:Ig-like domain-containing protein [Phycicoccus avicenniae]MBR7742622.1 fibronectin type III domain-containing protein [Phycicoccus avicenniae]
MRPDPARRGGRAASGARRRVASLVTVVLVASGLGYAAVASQGTTVHETELDDAGVWVSSGVQAKFAKANVPVGQLDTGVATDVPTGSGLDVLQDGASVLGLSTGTGSLFPIDVRTSTAADAVATVEPGAGDDTVFAPRNVDLRGGTVAMLARESGELFAQRVDPRTGTDSFGGLAVGAEPVAEIGGAGAVTVGLDGAVRAVSGEDGTVTTLTPTTAGFGAPTVVETALRTAVPDITVVGSTWVAYDAATDTLFTEDRPDGFPAQALAGDGDTLAALQQPGPDAEAVVLQTVGRAVPVPLGDGDRVGGVVVGEQVDRVPGATLVSRPVVLDGCLHAAWAEQGQVFYGANCGRVEPQPTATLPAEGSEPTRDGVAFRVNRGLVVLNDLDNGGVWDLTDQPVKIDDWDALTPPTQQDDDNEKEDENLLDEAVLEQPPTAEPDETTVRPGRTSKLHVLDNDTDVAGSVLSIDQRDVSAPTMEGVTATVSADGQAVDVSVPEGTEGQSFEFRYKVNNGATVSEQDARVAVRIVPDEVNGPPRLRPGAELTAADYPVIAGKRLSVPVLADWRDPENDILAARADREGSVVDGAGRVTLTAPTETGLQPVAYVVTDGRGGSTEGTVRARVLEAGGEDDFVPPTTQPDAVRGVVGKPLQVDPLGNDIAGADPAEPDASLALRSEVRPVGPLQVDTDLATGTVTVTGSAPGTYELGYSAVTGAGAAPGRIRVDIVEPPEGAPPVSVPDSATLNDQAPAMVDVLANDYSPRGDVLVTASVESDGGSEWIQPSIYQGRWVRLEAREPTPTGADRRGTVRYTVSDGSQRVTGEVSVLQQAALEDAVPIVEDDEAVVREGDTVSVPVLDNDTMADGIPLRLDPGSVRVVSEDDEQRAFASGNVIRYVPEHTGLVTDRFVTIEYAAYAEGFKERAQSARVRVQVTPLPSAQRVNQAPVARSFTATVTAGDPLTMTVPTFGVDADGDSVTVTGVVGAEGGPVDLTHGRVVGIGPTTIRYEAFPLAAGTEVITYEVRDRFGATSRAYVRVGVVQPGDPQPPVAVPDEVFAAPGKTVTVRPLANDLIARGDVVEVETDTLNSAETMEQWDVDEDHVVTTEVPDDTTRLHQMVYGIGNGLFDPSRASILVRPVPGYENPPVANDDVAAFEAGETSALVDVLANDTDVDSDPATLRVVDVLSPDAALDPATGQVRVQVLDRPYSVPYVIEDEDGLRAMALVHVPTGADGQPFVVPGTLVEMDQDSSETVALNDHVRSPRDRPVSVTAADTVSASPAENLEVTLTDNQTLELTSSNGYVGPAAVMLEVTDQTELDQTDVGTAYVSIPMQIGPKVPLLRCPDGAVTLTAGGLPRRVDIPTFCHAWVPVGMTLDDVEFETSWTEEPDANLSVDGPGGRLLTLSADAGARSSTGALAVSSPGMDEASAIAVRVVGRGDEKAEDDGGSEDEDESPLPPASVRPISVTGLTEGDTVTVDVRPYLDSPLPDPSCTVTGAAVESGEGITASASGCEVTLTAGERPSLEARVGITVVDGPDRQAVPGRIAVTLLGRPSVPQQVGAVADRDAGGQARVSWLPPEYDGGSAVTAYTVRWTGGGTGTRRCSASPCTVQGLTNGEDYRFTVAAVNGVGEGEESAPTPAVRPDKLPERVTGVRMVDRGDGTLTIGWDEPVNEGSAISKYVVRLISSDGDTVTEDVPASTRRRTVGGLDNMAEQEVQVQAWNELGAGPFGPAVTMQSAGTPPALPAPDIAASGPGPARDSATLTVSWQQGSPNGPPTSGYTLYQSVDGGGWTRVRDTAPDVRQARVVIPYDGRTYRYAATLTNGADIEGPRRNSSSFTSVGQPSNPSVTARTPDSNRRIQLVVGVGQPRAGGFTAIRWRGGGQSGTYSCGCAPGSTVRFDVGPFDTSPTNNRTITVWTVNSGGQESNQRSDSATPYGNTLTPTGFNGSRSGDRVTWSWNLPTNGRTIDQVQLQGAVSGTYGGNKTSQSIDRGPGTYRLRVRSHSAAGWSGWTAYRSVTVPNPPPPPPSDPITNLRPNGPTNDCGNCRDILWNAPGVPNGTYTMRCYRGGRSDPFYTGQARVEGGRRASGYCALDPNLSDRARIVLAGGGRTYDSGMQRWFP